MPASTQTTYIQRLNLALNYITAHLGEPITLEGLAGVAGFSPFHFHRIFKSLTGETLGEYIQRLRLERAANLLRNQPHISIIEITTTCGFSSPAVFSRTFKQRFGRSPSQFRQAAFRNESQAISNRDQAVLSSGDYPIRRERRNRMINVEVRTLPDLHVAYLRHRYGYRKGINNEKIGEAFQRVCRWVSAHDLFGPETQVIGIPYDNPDITPSEKCRYDACVTIPQGVKSAEGEISIQDIPGGKYAICRIDVSTAETHLIGETVDWLYGEWLPESGFHADDRPALEIYYDSPGKKAGTWITMDFCLPIKPF